MPISYTCLCCVFDDDGVATIDASYMSQLDATPELGFYKPSFSISRVNYGTFSADVTERLRAGQAPPLRTNRPFCSDIIVDIDLFLVT